MDLVFNPDNGAKRVEDAFKCAMQEISDNLKKGIKGTDLYIPKDIAGLVRSKINDEIKRQGKENNFTWCNVRQGVNPFTGRVEYFSGETIGDDKHYKLKYIT